MISRGKDSGEGVCSATTGRVVSRRGPPRCVAGRARRRRVVNDARRRRDEARRGREEAEAPSPKSRVGRGEARAVVARRSRSRGTARHLGRHGTAAGEEAAEAAALGRRRRRGGRARRAEGAGRGGVGPGRAEGPRLTRGLRAVDGAEHRYLGRRGRARPDGCGRPPREARVPQQRRRQALHGRLLRRGHARPARRPPWHDAFSQRDIDLRSR